MYYLYDEKNQKKNCFSRLAKNEIKMNFNIFFRLLFFNKSLSYIGRIRKEQQSICIGKYFCWNNFFLFFLGISYISAKNILIVQLHWESARPIENYNLRGVLMKLGVFGRRFNLIYTDWAFLRALISRAFNFWKLFSHKKVLKETLAFCLCEVSSWIYKEWNMTYETV